MNFPASMKENLIEKYRKTMIPYISKTLMKSFPKFNNDKWGMKLDCLSFYYQRWDYKDMVELLC